MESKILFIDLDGTIIETVSGDTFPRDYNDWKLKPNTVKEIIKKKNLGYLVILVTNQAGMQFGKVQIKPFTNKLNSIQRKVGVEFDEIFIARTNRSPYRKPEYKALLANLKAKGISVDRESSLMIGDAGGRDTDFSDSDKMFAEGMNITFVHVNDL